MHKLGYHAVEIHTPEPESLPIDRLHEICIEQGMMIATLGTGMIYRKYGLSLMASDLHKRQDIVARVFKNIDIAAKLRSRLTVGSIKGNVPRNGNRALHLGWMAECLHEITEYAERKKVVLLLEATNRYENNVLNTAAETREYIVKNNLKNTLVLLDSFHMNIEEKQAYSCLQDAGEYLGHLHFADNNRLYPGAGCFDFDSLCRHITQIGYDGVVSVEALPLPDELTVASK